MATAEPLHFTEPADDQEAVAANIRALMGRYRVSQSRLASTIGMSPAGLSERLSGKTNFTVRELGKVARFFGKSLGDLVAPLALVSLALAALRNEEEAPPEVLQLSLFGEELRSTAALVEPAAGEVESGPRHAHKEAA